MTCNELMEEVYLECEGILADCGGDIETAKQYTIELFKGIGMTNEKIHGIFMRAFDVLGKREGATNCDRN